MKKLPTLCWHLHLSLWKAMEVQVWPEQKKKPFELGPTPGVSCRTSGRVKRNMQIISCVAKIVFAKFEFETEVSVANQFYVLIDAHLDTSNWRRYPVEGVQKQRHKANIRSICIAKRTPSFISSVGSFSRQLLHTFPLLLFCVLCYPFLATFHSLVFFPCMPLTFYFTRFPTQRKCRNDMRNVVYPAKNSIGHELIVWYAPLNFRGCIAKKMHADGKNFHALGKWKAGRQGQLKKSGTKKYYLNDNLLLCFVE